MLGGALGSVGRYGIVVLTTGIFGQAWPIGTLLANVLGSGAMGFLMAFFNVSEALALAGELRAFVFVGLLGGFTTFSAFSMDSVNLLLSGQFLLGAAYVLLSVFLCLGITWGAYQMGHLLFAR